MEDSGHRAFGLGGGFPGRLAEAADSATLKCKTAAMIDRRTFLAASLLAASCPALARSPLRPARQVLAFYYGWYGTPSSGGWRHWNPNPNAPRAQEGITDHPLLGRYDSLDPSVIRKHLALAAQAGITGLVSSWWGQGDPTDRATEMLVNAAGRTSLKVTAYVEKADDAAGAERDLRYLVERYGSKPGWLKVGGRPVVFLYTRALERVSPAQWRAAARRVAVGPLPEPVLIADISPSDRPRLSAATPFMDGFHQYSLAGWLHGHSPAEIDRMTRDAYSASRQLVADRIRCLTVGPGYDDSHTSNPPPRPIIDRANGRTFQTLWRNAIAAKPDWVVVSTFNEWHEGTEIEPSREYGRSFLEINRRYARAFLVS